MPPVHVVAKESGIDTDDKVDWIERFQHAKREMVEREPEKINFDIPEEPGGAEGDIDADFRRKLAGLRRLPYREKIHALRAAKNARRLALRALRERRLVARLAAFVAIVKQKPAPS